MSSQPKARLMRMEGCMLLITWPMTEMAQVGLLLRKAEATSILIPSFPAQVQAGGLGTDT